MNLISHLKQAQDRAARSIGAANYNYTSVEDPNPDKEDVLLQRASERIHRSEADHRAATEALAAASALYEALALSDAWIRSAIADAGCKLPAAETLSRNAEALAKAGLRP